MILGSLIGVRARDKFAADPKRVEAITEAAFDEIAINPLIDEQIRKNKVIMRELSARVSKEMKLQGQPAAARRSPRKHAKARSAPKSQ